MNFRNDKGFIALSLFIVAIFLGSLFFVSYTTISSHYDAGKKTQATPKIKKISFVGVGDNLIHDSIYIAADSHDGVIGDGKYNFDHFYANISNDIKKYDIAYINQESIISGDSSGISTYPRFNTPESMIPSLKKSGFNLINLVNNHSMDMGSQGILNSINIWKKTGLYYGGLYESQESRNKPLIIDKNGVKIGVLFYTYGTNGMFPKNDYMVSYLNENKVREDFARIKDKVDFVIVSTHWGDEGIEALSAQQVKFAKIFNDLGVDMVIGTHAHRIQKTEWLTNNNGKKTLVFYGTGNFVHNMLRPTTYLEAMVSCDFVVDGNKKYIKNAKFTPLVFHLERTNFGYDGAVYRLDKYPIDLANKHIEMYGQGQYNINLYKEKLKELVPAQMLDLK